MTQRNLCTLLCSFFLIGAASFLNGQTTTNKILLFNGKDLSNWDFKLKDPNVDPSSVFKVKDGVISISGNPFGYMRTKDIYSNYKLHAEWRYPSEPSNSGIFVHAQLPDTIWLRCIEIQLKDGNAGDFVCMNGATLKEQADPSKRVVQKMASSSEKLTGQWNLMDITCKNNFIVVVVNGILQNKGTEVSVNKGNICLQSEGKEIEFRNVYLVKE